MRSFREILEAELAGRVARNPRYSQRAFARDLEISPSMFSEILSGRKHPSRRMAAQMAKAIGYDREQTSLLCDLAESKSSRSATRRTEAKARVSHASSTFAKLSEAQFERIADWRAMAALETFNLEGFSFDVEQLQTRLRLTTAHAKRLIEGLVNSGVLRKLGGRYVKTQNANTIESVTGSITIRTFHISLLKKAIEALNQRVDKRDYSAMIMAVRDADIGEAKAFIREFRREFDRRFCCTDKSATNIYALSIQYFDLLEDP